ncbi:hypothetical protein NHX12_007870 [Muraenolepis orangiensis]|uniref:MORN repeat-containing protein 5 n=1 Tax=Muraenolepis orangiensis TaxID=630683 RepID=A0A9Q0DSG5_9TELE|nr:hypothetical protein NHX12_007870 [Muraenolepis orangiensis]
MKIHFPVFLLTFPALFPWPGSWVDDQRQGQGVYTYADGDTYDGGWLLDVRHGAGTYRYKDSLFLGTWAHDEQNGAGVIVHANHRYEGTFINNQKVHALYFVDRFPELLPYNLPDERYKLSEEFLDYQSMDIAMPEDPATFDIESFWGNMASMKNKVRIILHPLKYPLT